MKGTIATASRDVVAIKKRKISYYTYRGLQEIARLRTETGDTTTALLYPMIRSQDTLTDLLNRLAWYLPKSTLPDDCRLFLGIEDGPDVHAALTDAPEFQASFDGDHLPLELVAPDAMGRLADEVDLLLVWDAEARTSVPAVKNLAKVEFVDPQYWSGTESYTWGIASDSLRRSDENSSSDLYRTLEERSADYRRSYVFATGPSLDEATEFDFDDDSLKVVCNSIVRNDAMLEHIDPDVLVFADPVFHFGPSRYADQFRRDAIDALRRFDCLAVIPSQHQTLMDGHYPDTDFASLRTVRSSEPHFPTAEDLRVMATNNIMTMFMLPIASGLTEEVNVIGADGREQSESYFWEHNESAQYDDDVMKTAVDCHPSFFRDKIYSDYYDDHVSTLENMIEYGERRGVRYYNLTHSYISCLAERSVADPLQHVSTDR